MALSIDRLEHYTGTAAASFQRYVLLTNYSWHVESATVAANGFRYRIPTATLLAVSDKPLHAQPKLSSARCNA